MLAPLALKLGGVAHTPLKLLPPIAAAAKVRAKQLDLSFAGYVSVLIHNQDVRPTAIGPIPDSLTLARVHVPCSWRAGLRPTACKLARAAGLSINALVESLMAADLLSPSPDLAIRARGPKPKLQL